MTCRNSPVAMRIIPAALVLAAAASGLGCLQEAGPPKDATPIVSADSEQAKKAQAETAKMLLERQKQEAQAKKRIRGLPEEG